jgi:chorismate dehydratase
MLKIGHINYANCTPIFTAMRELFSKDRYQFIMGVPAELNNMLATGGIDLCPSSSIAYSMMPDRLLIMPELSISSFGAVQSVLLFSRLPIDELGGRMVHLSAESATSVNLLKILLKKRYSLDCLFQPTSLSLLDSLKSADALLLIGDAALKASYSSPGTYIYDLGQLWFEWTGTPFVFALWLASRDSFARNRDDFMSIANRFVAAKHYAMAHLDRIAQQADEREWMGSERLIDYWKVLSYDLSEQHIIGLNLFFQYAAELGLINKTPELAFLE